MSCGRGIIFSSGMLLLIGCHPDLGTVKRNCTEVNRTPRITPDYAGVTIPPNIAPLHFILKDSCTSCVAEIASVNGAPIVTWGKKGVLRIGTVAWKRLLSENSGNPLHITIYARNAHGSWQRYTTVENTIAREPIDRFCTYRLLNFQYSYWRDLRICQRDLTSFKEVTLINTQHYTTSGEGKDGFRCVNCHIPLNNDANRFVLQLRSAAYGAETFIADGDHITKLSSRLGHTAWHPGGNCIAFAVYKVQQYFHAVGRHPIEVYDNNSGIVVYDVASHKTIPVPQLDRVRVLETWPAWSPDGRYLYFCSSPVLWSDFHKEPPDSFNRTQYSLLRIPYDAARKSWGEVDTVLATAETGLSIALPRISPDNRFCIFCMQHYGAYPYIEESSDLYLMDVTTRHYHKLTINSEYNESWHSWSKNSRWILFSSRRGDGIFTRLYISYIDSTGHARKPFILPQRDPAFYDSFTRCYNVAEFATSPVRFTERQLLKAIESQHSITVPIQSDDSGDSTGTSPGNHPEMYF